MLPNGRKVDAARRAADLATALATNAVLDGALRVPDAIADITMAADVKAQLLTASIDVEVPRDRGSRARVSWLVNQLDKAPERTILENWPRSARAAVASATLAATRDDRTILLADGKEPSRIRVVLRAPMGVGRKAGTKSAGFVDSVLALIDEFYELIVQNIATWQPPAPRKQPVPVLEERVVTIEGTATVQPMVSDSAEQPTPSDYAEVEAAG